MELTRRQALQYLGAATGGGIMSRREFLGPGGPALINTIAEDSVTRREVLLGLLGDLPDRNSPVKATRRSEVERDGYILETLELDLNGIEPVPAYVAKPKKLDGPAPVVLYNHAHGGDYKLGKTEFIESRSLLQRLPYAKVITDLGWIGLCFDTWVFGERSHTSELDMFKAMLWQGRVLWGMMVFDSIRAIDYLETRDDVDPARIATVGLSMGSTMAWWTAALDERIKVTVDICCLTDFHTFLRKKALAGHGIYYYVPSLLKHFTTADINALIAPRPHLALAGIRDNLTPPEGLDIVDAALKEVYAAHGVPDNWRLIRYDEGHKETPEGRKEIVEFLRKHV